MSTALSTKVSLPVAGVASASCGTAITCSGSLVMCRLIVGRWVAGTEKVTYTGSTRATVMSSVLFAVTRLPTFTDRLPVRPSIGERMVV